MKWVQEESTSYTWFVGNCGSSVYGILQVLVQSPPFPDYPLLLAVRFGLVSEIPQSSSREIKGEMHGILGINTLLFALRIIRLKRIPSIDASG